jgi:tellurite resistance protein TehA-like permease
MSIVAVAILISFHLKAEASPLEKRIALPFGLVFWLLAIACLAAGLNNYIKTVSRYSRRQALVQSGTGTQLVSESINARERAGPLLYPRAMLI